MARIRSIHPGIATDERYMAMSIYAKAAWPLLWMECDDHGVFEWKPLVLKARIFPVDSINFEQLLDEWGRLGSVQKVEIAGREYGLVRNFCRYQRPKKPNYRITIPAEFHTYVGLLPDGSPPVRNQYGTGGESPCQMEEGGGRREEEEGKESVSGAVADATRPTHESDFEDFWEAYPRRQGANPREPARKAFVAAIKAGATAEAIIAGAKQCAAQDHAKVGTEFIPRAVTWLEEKRWQDYPPPSAVVVPIKGYYAAAESQQLAAWDAYSKAQKGKTLPRDSKGGWHVESEWPPGDTRLPTFLRRDIAAEKRNAG